jgi:cytochrome P450
VLDVLGDRTFACLPPAFDNPHADPLGFKDTILFSDGNEHERLKRLLAPMFSKTRLIAVQHYIDAQVATLLAPLHRRTRFDLVAELATELPVRTVCFLLGFPESAADAYRRASRGAWQLISFMRLSATERRQAVADTERFLLDIDACIDACRDGGDPTHPLADFLALERRGEISRRAIAMNVLLLFIAGYGTTLLSIGNGVAAVLQAPRRRRPGAARGSRTAALRSRGAGAVPLCAGRRRTRRLPDPARRSAHPAARLRQSRSGRVRRSRHGRFSSRRRT